MNDGLRGASEIGLYVHRRTDLFGGPIGPGNVLFRNNKSTNVSDDQHCRIQGLPVGMILGRLAKGDPNR